MARSRSGPFQVDPSTSLAIRRHFACKGGSVDLAETARIAFAPFAELELGERVSGPEIKRRIGIIRATGYDVQKGYWSMGADQAWRYLLKIREELAGYGFGPER